MYTQAYDLTDEDQFVQLVADFAVRSNGLPDSREDLWSSRFRRTREADKEEIEDSTDAWTCLIVSHQRKQRQQQRIAALTPP